MTTICKSKTCWIAHPRQKYAQKNVQNCNYNLAINILKANLCLYLLFSSFPDELKIVFSFHQKK